MTRRVQRLAVCAATLVVGCGSRSRLVDDDPPLVYLDAARDAIDAADVRDVRPVCVPTRLTLPRPRAEALLVIDRSGSMDLDLQGRSGSPTRWQVMRESLTTSLARYASQLTLGMMLFPGPAQTFQCGVDAEPATPVAANSVASILTAIERVSPGGRTPTWNALDVAGRALRARAADGVVQSVVLATDGAPNCNGLLDGRRCTCTGTGSTGQLQCEDDPSLCLDDTRTAASVTALAASGIGVYVIGIDGDAQPELLAVLDALAVAGGHPNQGARRYYSVRRPEDLAGAFDSIQREIATCAWALPTSLRGDRLTVRVDGAAVPEDPTRAEGWALTAGSLTFYGASCARATASGVEVTVRCDDDAP